MKTRIAVISIVFAFCGFLFGAERSLEEQRAEAANAQPKDQPKLYVAIAQRELKTIDSLYAANDVEKAPAALQQLAADCETAAKSATTTHKNMKHVEISLRKIGSRLESIQRSVAFDDRPPIKAAIDRVEKARSSLLDAMFAK